MFLVIEPATGMSVPTGWYGYRADAVIVWVGNVTPSRSQPPFIVNEDVVEEVGIEARQPVGPRLAVLIREHDDASREAVGLAVDGFSCR